MSQCPQSNMGKIYGWGMGYSGGACKGLTWSRPLFKEVLLALVDQLQHKVSTLHVMQHSLTGCAEQGILCCRPPIVREMPGKSSVSGVGHLRLPADPTGSHCLEASPCRVAVCPELKHLQGAELILRILQSPAFMHLRRPIVLSSYVQRYAICLYSSICDC